MHGVLLLDKPRGLSSNDALQKAKWLLRAEKGGHTGTLDPLATGVLPLCFGAATKFSQIHLDADKTYEATLSLGTTTTTGDLEGDVLDVRPVNVTDDAVNEAVARFRGPISQVPPMYSALKFEGKPLYEYARAGLSVPREARNVTVHELSWAWAQPSSTEFSNKESALQAADYARAAINFVASVSKGTYIRTLGEDIAAALGCGGHLTALRRTRSGPFVQARCVSLAALEAMPESERQAQLLPPQSLLEGDPTLELDAANAGRFLSGLRRRLEGESPNAERVAVYGPGNEIHARALLGIGRITAGELIPIRLLSPLEVGQILEIS